MALITIDLDDDGMIRAKLDADTIMSMDQNHMSAIVECLESCRSQIMSQMLGTKTTVGMVVDVTSEDTLLVIREHLVFHPNGLKVIDHLLGTLRNSRDRMVAMHKERH